MEKNSILASKILVLKVRSALTVRNLCGHLLDLNMDILDNRNITSKHLGRKGLHLNKAGSTRLAKNIIHKF